jgi:hypothetical protein
MGSEKQFETKVKKWLESEGIYSAGTPEQKITVPQVGWYLKTWGGGYQKSGIPDLLLCVNGIFISAELKGDSGKPSELQLKNTVSINASGGVGLVLYPKGFEQFKYIVKGVIQCNVHTVELKALKNAHSSTSCVIVTKY